ncbi:MAG TPA: response regulator transcription factor [Caldilineae bacterium]|nr:response regulator transcription factor [Caldilineae bacterium]
MKTDVDAIKVLIVEDNAIYRQSLYRMLQQDEGMVMLEPAEDGLEALEKSARLRPDVILMDIDMPEQDGLLAAQRIRQRWPEVKLIILTLHSSEAFQAWAEEVGDAAFFFKDAGPDEIVRAIRMASSLIPRGLQRGWGGGRGTLID